MTAEQEKAFNEAAKLDNPTHDPEYPFFWDKERLHRVVDAVLAVPCEACVAREREALANRDNIPHGCHLMLEDTVSGEPDGCVLDESPVERCIYAEELAKDGKDKWSCEYWKAIKPKESPVPVRPVFEWVEADVLECYVNGRFIGYVMPKRDKWKANTTQERDEERTFDAEAEATSHVEDSFITWLSQIQRGAK